MAGPGANAQDSVQDLFTQWVEEQRQIAAGLGTLAFAPINQVPEQHPIHEHPPQFGPTPPDSRPNSFPSPYQQGPAQATGAGHLVQYSQPNPAPRQHLPVHQYHQQPRLTPPEPASFPLHTSYHQVPTQAIGPGHFVRDFQPNFTPQQYFPAHQQHQQQHQQQHRQSAFTPPDPTTFLLPTSYQHAPTQATGPRPSRRYPRIDRSGGIPCLNPNAAFLGPDPVNPSQYLRSSGELPDYRDLLHNTRQPIPSERKFLTNQPIPPQSAFLDRRPARVEQPAQFGRPYPNYGPFPSQEPIPDRRPARVEQPAHFGRRVLTSEPHFGRSHTTYGPLPSQEPIPDRRPAGVEQPAHFGRVFAHEPLPSQEPVLDRRPDCVEEAAHFGRRVLTYEPLLAQDPVLYRRPAHAEQAPVAVVPDRGLDLDEVDRQLTLYQQIVGVERPPLTSEPLPPRQPVPGQQRIVNEQPVLPGTQLITFASVAPAATQQPVSPGRLLARQRTPFEHSPGTHEQPIWLEDDPPPPYRSPKRHNRRITPPKTQQARRGQHPTSARQPIYFSEAFWDGTKRGRPRSHSEVSPRGTKHGRPRSSSERSPHNPNCGRRRSPSAPPPSSLHVDQLQLASSAPDAKRSRPRSASEGSPRDPKRGRHRSPSASSPSSLPLDQRQLASPTPEGQLPNNRQNQPQPAPPVCQGEQPLRPPLPTRQSEHTLIPPPHREPTAPSTPPRVPPRGSFRTPRNRPLPNRRERPRSNIRRGPINPSPPPSISPHHLFRTQPTRPPNNTSERLNLGGQPVRTDLFHPLPRPPVGLFRTQSTRSVRNTHERQQPSLQPDPTQSISPSPPPQPILPPTHPDSPPIHSITPLIQPAPYQAPESYLRTPILPQPESTPPSAPEPTSPPAIFLQGPESNLRTPINPQPEPAPPPNDPTPYEALDSNLHTPILPQPEAAPPPTDPRPYQAPESYLRTPILPQPGSQPTAPVTMPPAAVRTAVPGVPDTDPFTPAQDRQARGHEPTVLESPQPNRRQVHTPASRAQAALAAVNTTRAQAALARGQAGVGTANFRAQATTLRGEMMRGAEGRGGSASGAGVGGSERRGSAGVEMPDSFAELQRREQYIAVTDSWERMAGVACRDCEEREGGSGEGEMNEGSGNVEVSEDVGAEVVAEARKVERSPSSSGLEEGEIREGSEEGEIIESEPDECALKVRGGWIGRGRPRRCRRGRARSIPQTRLRYQKKVIGVEDRDDMWEDAYEVVWRDEEKVEASSDDGEGGEADGQDVKGGVFGVGPKAGGGGGKGKGADGKGKGGAGGGSGSGSGRGAGGSGNGRGGTGKEKDAGGSGAGKGRGGRGSPKTDRKGKGGRRRGQVEREESVAGPSGTYARLREAQEGGRRR